MGICSSCSHRPLCRDVTPAMAKCSSFDPVFNAIKTAVDRYGADAQKKVFYGEVGELMTAISDTDRGRDNVAHITEELADVMVCMKQIAYIYGIKQAALLTAVHNKTVRLAHRLAEEDASVRNSNILGEVPSIVDALEMCSSDKCSDKCRYYGRPECCGGLMEDAAVLLKELSAQNGGGSK